MFKPAIAAIAGLGTVGTVSVGVYHFLFQEVKKEIKFIKDKLISEGFTILNQSETSHWTTLKNSYNTNKSHSDKVFKVEGTDIDENKLKSLCEDVLKKRKDDLSYSKAKRWCVVPVSITEHLANLKFKVLNTEGENDKSNWEELVKKYESSFKKISGLDTLTETKWEKIRDKCKEITAKKNYEDEFDVNLESSARWCAKI